MMFEWIDDPYEMSAEEEWNYRMMLLDYEAEKKGLREESEDDKQRRNEE